MTRATRSVSRDAENVNARPSRITTRAKPPSSSSATAAGVTTRASVLADAAIQKRKREALGEVTGKSVNNRVKSATDAKGKGKETTTALKPTKPTAPTTTTTTSRVPLRSVATRSTRNNTVVQTKAQKPEPVVVDHRQSKAVPVVEIPVPVQTTRRAVRSTVTTTTVRRTVHRRAPVARAEPEVEEPASKRRRTSSEVGDEEYKEVGNQALLDNIAEESEPAYAEDENVEPVATREPVIEVQDWDDLDRDDDDDPLMVSEYVADIFNYLKTVEVSVVPCLSQPIFN